jgi:hypothetical protein
MISRISLKIGALVLTLMLAASVNGQKLSDLKGRWLEKGGESIIEFTKEGGYIINFKPSLSDGSTTFKSDTYKRVDNNHLVFNIEMGKETIKEIDVKATIKKNNELRFSLDNKNYKFIKEPEPLFPDGVEIITLISASISPEQITVDGSDLKVYFINSDSISMSELVPVVKIVTNTMTITTRTRVVGAGLKINDDSSFTTTVSNPRNAYYTQGRISGSGTIYVYLEDSGKSSDENDAQRVSNVLSVYATFKP